MSLLSRVIRLESRINVPQKSVHVVFQQVGESNEKLVSRTKAENYAPEAMLIMVKFVEPLKRFPNKESPCKPIYIQRLF
jgi:hypothetical protein